MKFNRIDKIQFIYKGRQHTLRLKFYGYSSDNIPIYLSECINGVNVIRLEDSSILLIINELYINSASEDTINIEIFDKLLRYFFGIVNDNIVDCHLTRWFGVSNVIKYIDSLKNIDDTYKNNRISFIRENILGNNNFKVLDKQYIVNNLRFAEINELEI